MINKNKHVRTNKICRIFDASRWYTLPISILALIVIILVTITLYSERYFYHEFEKVDSIYQSLLYLTSGDSELSTFNKLAYCTDRDVAKHYQIHEASDRIDNSFIDKLFQKTIDPNGQDCVPADRVSIIQAEGVKYGLVRTAVSDDDYFIFYKQVYDGEATETESKSIDTVIASIIYNNKKELKYFPFVITFEDDKSPTLWGFFSDKQTMKVTGTYFWKVEISETKNKISCLSTIVEQESGGYTDNENIYRKPFHLDAYVFGDERIRVDEVNECVNIIAGIDFELLSNISVQLINNIVSISMPKTVFDENGLLGLRIIGYRCGSTNCNLTDTKIQDALNSIDYISTSSGFSEDLSRLTNLLSDYSVNVYGSQKVTGDAPSSKIAPILSSDSLGTVKSLGRFFLPVTRSVARWACGHYSNVKSRFGFLCSFDKSDASILKFTKNSLTEPEYIFPGRYLLTLDLKRVEEKLHYDIGVMFSAFLILLLLATLQQYCLRVFSMRLIIIKQEVQDQENRNKSFVKSVNHDMNKHWPVIRDALENENHDKKESALFSVEYIERLIVLYRAELSPREAEKKGLTIKDEVSLAIDDAGEDGCHVVKYALEWASRTCKSLGYDQINVPNNIEDYSNYSVKIHGMHLYIVLLHLLTNANCYREIGTGIDIRVCIVEENKRTYCKISVSNTTKDIPEPLMMKLFDRGFSYMGLQRGGTGEGLYIAREIITGAEGKIRIDQNNGIFMVVILIPAEEKNSSHDFQD